MWRRAMAKYAKRGGVAFQEHNVRAVVATKAKTLEHAAALFGPSGPQDHGSGIPPRPSAGVLTLPRLSYKHPDFGEFAPKS
jgi:hypothetical protein